MEENEATTDGIKIKVGDEFIVKSEPAVRPWKIGGFGYPIIEYPTKIKVKRIVDLHKIGVHIIIDNNDIKWYPDKTFKKVKKKQLIKIHS